tara:strand:- start:15260 stop:17533 length:2274 start_codon:yes stop_codon:yes gene_type:complete
VAKKVGKFVLTIDVEGLKDLSGLQRQLKGLEKSANPTARQLKSLGQSVRQITKFTPKTISQFKQKERILKKLRQEVNVNSRQFQILGRAIDSNRVKLQKFNNTAKKGTGFSKLGTGFGSILASQVLPGNTSQLALAGANIAGPKGAAIGAVIGAGMDFSSLAKDAAIFSGEIKRLEVALKGVTKTEKEFAKAQKVIASVSNELNVPIKNATKQFTTLSASVIGAGGSVDDAELVFRGVSEAIKATGGDAEDVQSAIRAMSQIFGKGKVSAEELQGQLGERLPGAVVKFADATGRTLPQLQKDLRDGTVGLNDVMKFVVKLSDDHAQAAKNMANSTADAGARMQVALDKLKKSFGDFFQPLGAMFQDLITNFANMLNAALETRNIIKTIELEKGKNVSGTVSNKALRDAEKQALKIARLRAGVFTEEDYKAGNVHQLSIGRQKPIDENEFRRLRDQIFKDNLRQYGYEQGILKGPVSVRDLTTFQGVTPEGDKGKEAATLDKYKLDLGIINQKEFEAREIRREASVILEKMKLDNKEFDMDLGQIIAKLTEARSGAFNFKEEMKKVAESALDLRTKIGELAVSSVNKLADGFAELAVSGKASFGDLARSILQDLQRMIVKALFFKAIFGLFPGLQKFLGFEKGGVVEKSAKGNVFAKNKIVPYASGGVIDKPVIFPMAKGMGLAGEAGPEAILPLKRGKGGRLGVEASGGVGNIVVNVDASGSNVEGDEEQGRQLGLVISAAIQSELIQQKRPGGLLA